MSNVRFIDQSFIAEVEAISDRYDTGYATYSNVDRPPKERGEFLRAIQILRSYEQNWDGNDALPPHAEALDTARVFIEKLPWQRRFPRSIYPGSDRSVVLEWGQSEDGGRLMLTIEPYYIGATYIRGNGEVVDLDDYALLPGSDSLSRELQYIVPRA